MALFKLKPVRPVRRQIDIRMPVGDQIGDDAAGLWSRGQADVLVAESKKHIVEFG